MKKIGSLFGMDVKITPGVGKNEIFIGTPDQETSNKVEEILQKQFQPGKWVKVENLKSVVASIDPNDYATIDREAFLKKYGKAGEKLLASERSSLLAQIEQRIESIKHTNTNEIFNGPVRPNAIWNEALDRVKSILKEIGGKDEA